jgi:hypothetical protein
MRQGYFPEFFQKLSFSVITNDLTLSSKDQNVFCIVKCKEDYDHLKLACKPIFQKINTLYEKASIEVFYGPYTMDKNNYIEIPPTQGQVANISYHHPSKYLKQNVSPQPLKHNFEIMEVI